MHDDIIHAYSTGCEYQVILEYVVYEMYEGVLKHICELETKYTRVYKIYISVPRNKKKQMVV